MLEVAAVMSQGDRAHIITTANTPLHKTEEDEKRAAVIIEGPRSVYP